MTKGKKRQKQNQKESSPSKPIVENDRPAIDNPQSANRARTFRTAEPPAPNGERGSAGEIETA